MNLEVNQKNDYELLASGDGRKLERFGSMTLERPAPQAIWPREVNAAWAAADAFFVRKEGGTGDWSLRDKSMAQSWKIKLETLVFELRLTGFGNVGLFPEHLCHFDWLARKIANRGGAEILNLFAYTGGASMACAAAGASVTHLDAAKSVNNWARLNAELTQLKNGRIRFLTEDAARFVKRELRRGKYYDGIILDPPTFGRGAKGEVWKIEQDLYQLLEICRLLLSKKPLFVLLTSHSPGVTPHVLRMLLSPFGGNIQSGEMLLSGTGPQLPQGAYARWEPINSAGQ